MLLFGFDLGFIFSLTPIEVAAVMGLLAAALTSIGALPVIILSPSRVKYDKLLDAGLGFSSGVMVTASFTSLLIPAIELGGIYPALIGVVLGATMVHAVNMVIPHEHYLKGVVEGLSSSKVRAAWMVATAIIIHNIPEGLAIGATSAQSVRLGVATGLAIAIQDIPEGLAVALPILLVGHGTSKALAYAAVSGLSEAVFAVVAAVLGEWGIVTLPLLLSFAAGAMMYVVSHEAIPESHRTGHEKQATVGFFLGMLLMLYLDTAVAPP